MAYRKIVLIGVVVLLAGFGFVAGVNLLQPDRSTAETRQAAKEPKRFSREEVARHDGPDDCWTIIHGTVYELTAYIKRHPGGKEIERACGTDASILFETRTEADGRPIGSGTPHSTAAREQLEKLKVGELEL